MIASDETRAKAFLSRLNDEQIVALKYDWRGFWARPNQITPEGDWTTWLLLAGRGFGKTRTGAEWIRDRVESGLARYIALVASTTADARKVMVEGPAGLLAISPPWNRPHYEPSKRELTWSNGAVATTYSAEEPDVLRGPQHDTAWCDELAKWKYLEDAWDNLQFGLRLSERPRQVVTTTPRPLAILKSILARKDTVVTRGGTNENRENLARPFFEQVIRRYEGTRLGRQELGGEMLEDLPGALWTLAMLDNVRMRAADTLPDMARVVVGVDPSGTRGNDDRDKVGIVAAGKGIDGRAYVLGDYTCSLSPAGWGRRIADAVSEHKADCVVAEANFGGAMVESVMQTAQVSARVKMVMASRGKSVRAEPIAALYEQGRVKHFGTFQDLEDQLTSFTTSGYVGDHSPDNADAAIWALTELMLSDGGETGWLEFAQQSLAAKSIGAALAAKR